MVKKNTNEHDYFKNLNNDGELNEKADLILDEVRSVKRKSIYIKHARILFTRNHNILMLGI